MTPFLGSLKTHKIEDKTMYLYSIARHGRRRWRERSWTFAWRRRKSKMQLGRLQLRLRAQSGQQNLIFFDPKNVLFV
jgi:hypothetical protein